VPACVGVKQFRFGLHVLAPSGRDEWVSVAKQAEDIGFSVLTLPDHLIDGCLSPFAALGVAAQATSTLRIGTLVLNNDLRHPALVARETLALDLLSGGRVELGVGAGSPMGLPEYESIGIRFDDGATRVARLDESLRVLDGLLRGDDVTFAGEHYRLDAHRAWPSPTQRPRPPMLAGGSGRRILRMAPECADIVSLSGIGGTKPDGGTAGLAPDEIDDRVALIRAASARRDVELQVLVLRVILTEDPRGAAEEMRPFLPALTVDDILSLPYLWIGTVESISEHVIAARERWGFSYFTVFHDAMDATAPIIRCLADS
jgi:probable F420-dependent oxidoreductase